MKKIFFLSIAFAALSSCNDFLDREPLDQITPQAYFNSERDLAAHSVKLYEGAGFRTIAPGQYGISIFKDDNGTDNQAGPVGSNVWMPGEWRVSQGGAGWGFGMIRDCNYFLENALKKYKAGEIKGNEANIRQYIGEGYAIRANVYFNKLQAFGDFPIIKEVLPDDKAVLVEASKRRPRNEVARFILSDLDKAIEFLGETSPNGKNRLTRDAAYILKSRVALYEGTWLKYHKGTARVPGGPGWPGAGASYLKGFSIDIDSESRFFLEQAKEAAKAVADKMVSRLTPNSGKRIARAASGASLNDYYMMFASDDMESFPEVVFWRRYSRTELPHNIQIEHSARGGGSGYTKGFVESFLMKNGLPIYANNSGYAGDETLDNVIKDRDDRLRLFTKINDDVIYYDASGNEVKVGAPLILEGNESRSVTGYTVKKGMNFDRTDAESHQRAITGSVVFRGAEALLNYMEADYELNNVLDESSKNYWRALRARANVDTDFQKTIDATDMEKEKLGDFGAYSAGNLVDKTLYNIRRERRDEFIAEGMRWADLRRWRAMDQIKTKPYIIEGVKIWGPMKDWYVDGTGKSLLVENDVTGNVSPKANSMYLRPYQRNKTNNLFYDGYKWNDAHYLNPLPTDAFRLTESKDGDLDSSDVYQNPGWSKVSGESVK